MEKEIAWLNYKTAADNLFVVFNSCGSFLNRPHVFILKEIRLVLCHTVVPSASISLLILLLQVFFIPVVLFNHPDWFGESSGDIHSRDVGLRWHWAKTSKQNGFRSGCYLSKGLDRSFFLFHH